MIYKGTELVEVVEPQTFRPPKLMLVWNDCDVDSILKGEYDLKQVKVYGIIDDTGSRVVSLVDGSIELFEHCAEIPEEPKPRRATNRELAWWLAQGYGQKSGNKGIACISYSYGHLADDCEIDKIVVVRKWGDADWHEPTVDYLGIKE